METQHWIRAGSAGRSSSATVRVCPYCMEVAGDRALCPGCGRGSEGACLDFRVEVKASEHARLAKAACPRCGGAKAVEAAICPHCRAKARPRPTRPSIYREIRGHSRQISLPMVLASLEADLHGTRRIHPSLALRTLLEIIAARTDIHAADIDLDTGLLGLDLPADSVRHPWAGEAPPARAELNGLLLIEIVLDTEIVFAARTGGIAWPTNPTPRQLFDLLVKNGEWNPPGLGAECGSCGLGYRAPIARAGDEVACRRCHATVHVPWPSPSVWGEPDEEDGALDATGRIDVARTDTDRLRRAQARSS